MNTNDRIEIFRTKNSDGEMFNLAFFEGIMVAASHSLDRVIQRARRRRPHAVEVVSYLEPQPAAIIQRYQDRKWN